MLPSAYRMRRAADFRCAVRSGRRAGRRSLVVHLKQGMPGDDRVRVGFVVSRAVGGAVVRNRVKRRLRAHMATWVRDLEPGSLVVVRASPAAATASWEELGTDLRTALARVRANRAGRPGERGQPRVGVDR